MFMDKTTKPYIVAGPCSVESREQLREVTEALAKIPQVQMIRAGVWKPRTRPGGFEGLGAQALAWMRELAAEYGVRYCCEVATPEHVEACLQHGIGTVWIGARTTANPFMVEELCTALQGSPMTVMVKNPVCPDARLWLGAVERLQQAGIQEVMAIHRGFSMYDNHGYRNDPLWEVPMEFRRERPDIPILCDPSHIGGRRELVVPLATAARQLDYSGLMVEVHPYPAAAWTDGEQQVTPRELAAVVEAWLAARQEGTGGDERLEPLRRRIDEIDHELVALLSQRMAVSRHIATVKREEHIPVYQSGRWSDVLEDRLRQAAALGLDTSFTKEMLEKIHGESVRVQIESQ